MLMINLIHALVITLALAIYGYLVDNQFTEKQLLFVALVAFGGLVLDSVLTETAVNLFNRSENP